MGTAEVARRNGKLGGRPKGAKAWKTIKKEEWAKHYEEEMAKKWAHIVDVHLEEASKAPNREERKLAIEQVRGKATEKVDLSVEGVLKLDV